MLINIVLKRVIGQRDCLLSLLRERDSVDLLLSISELVSLKLVCLKLAYLNLDHR